MRVVDASDRRGLNHARNVGLASSAGDFVVYCDGDDRAAPTWLNEMVRAACSGDIVAGALADVVDPLPVKHGFLPGLRGGNCGMWRDVAVELGWDESFAFGSSDIELTWRAVLAGHRIVVAPEAIIHVGRPKQLRSVARQWFLYGLSDGQLYRTFRDRGMPRSRVARAVATWGWLVVHLPDLGHDEGHARDGCGRPHGTPVESQAVSATACCSCETTRASPRAAGHRMTIERQVRWHEQPLGRVDNFTAAGHRRRDFFPTAFSSCPKRRRTAARSQPVRDCVPVRRICGRSSCLPTPPHRPEYRPTCSSMTRWCGIASSSAWRDRSPPPAWWCEGERRTPPLITPTSCRGSRAAGAQDARRDPVQGLGPDAAEWHPQLRRRAGLAHGDGADGSHRDDPDGPDPVGRPRVVRADL